METSIGHTTKEKNEGGTDLEISKGGTEKGKRIEGHIRCDNDC